jgi:hypothetical protein
MTTSSHKRESSTRARIGHALGQGSTVGCDRCGKPLSAAGAWTVVEAAARPGEGVPPYVPVHVTCPAGGVR